MEKTQLGDVNPNVLPLDAFKLTGNQTSAERLISLKAPWKFDGEAVNYPISGYVAGRGYWEKQADHRLRQVWITTIASVARTTASGALYRTALQSGGLWPIEFTTFLGSRVIFEKGSTGSWAFRGDATSQSTTSTGAFYIIGTSSVTLTNVEIQIEGWGTW